MPARKPPASGSAMPVDEGGIIEYRCGTLTPGSRTYGGIPPPCRSPGRMRARNSWLMSLARPGVRVPGTWQAFPKMSCLRSLPSSWSSLQKAAVLGGQREGLCLGNAKPCGESVIIGCLRGTLSSGSRTSGGRPPPCRSPERTRVLNSWLISLARPGVRVFGKWKVFHRRSS